MQEGELVAAIAAGDPEGIAAAYDRYAASLYAYCHFRLTSQDAAAEAVLDTFAVAVVKVQTLRDPARLGPWLHAVARNECLRRLEPAGGTFPVTGPIPVAGLASAGDDEPVSGLPAELRSQVLAVCADSSPRGRAHRAALADRAGTFGPTGFPTAPGSSGARWWRPVRRHPRIAAAAAVAVLAAVAGLSTLAVTSGSPPAGVATLTLGDADAGTTADTASSPGLSPAPAPVPGQTSANPAAPSAAILTSTPRPVLPADNGTPQPAAGTPAVSRSPSNSAPAVKAPASPSASPALKPSVAAGAALQGHLMVSPTKLVLTSDDGKAASGTFVITALNGPVSQYTVTVPKAMAGKVTVSPSSGSLASDGWVTVTVTVTAKVAIDTKVTVNPGGVAVGVLLSVTT
jgi:DNA-directed RNA polymerase specialized sigma24 family protein